MSNQENQEKLEKKYGEKFDLLNTKFEIGIIIIYMTYPFNKTDKMKIGELTSYTSGIGNTTTERFRLYQGVVVDKQYKHNIEKYPERFV